MKQSIYSLLNLKKNKIRVIDRIRDQLNQQTQIGLFHVYESDQDSGMMGIQLRSIESLKSLSREAGQIRSYLYEMQIFGGLSFTEEVDADQSTFIITEVDDEVFLGIQNADSKHVDIIAKKSPLINLDNNKSTSENHQPIQLMDLPNEILLIIMSNLPISLLLNITLVCKQFNLLVNHTFYDRFKNDEDLKDIKPVPFFGRDFGKYVYFSTPKNLLNECQNQIQNAKALRKLLDMEEDEMKLIKKYQSFGNKLQYPSEVIAKRIMQAQFESLKRVDQKSLIRLFVYTGEPSGANPFLTYLFEKNDSTMLDEIFLSLICRLLFLVSGDDVLVKKSASLQTATELSNIIQSCIERGMTFKEHEKNPEFLILWQATQVLDQGSLFDCWFRTFAQLCASSDKGFERLKASWDEMNEEGYWKQSGASDEQIKSLQAKFEDYVEKFKQEMTIQDICVPISPAMW